MYAKTDGSCIVSQKAFLSLGLSRWDRGELGCEFRSKDLFSFVQREHIDFRYQKLHSFIQYKTGVSNAKICERAWQACMEMVFFYYCRKETLRWKSFCLKKVVIITGKALVWWTQLLIKKTRGLLFISLGFFPFVSVCCLIKIKILLKLFKVFITKATYFGLLQTKTLYSTPRELQLLRFSTKRKTKYLLAIKKQPLQENPLLAKHLTSNSGSARKYETCSLTRDQNVGNGYFQKETINFLARLGAFVATVVANYRGDGENSVEWRQKKVH